MSDTHTEPVAVDAAAQRLDEARAKVALSQSVAGDEPASELISAIFAHQAADAAFYQDIMDAFADRDRATINFMRHGIAAALATNEFGGTTAQYEATLDRIEAVLNGGHMYNPIYAWYVEQARQARVDGNFFGELPAHEVHSGRGDLA